MVVSKDDRTLRQRALSRLQVTHPHRLPAASSYGPLAETLENRLLGGACQHAPRAAALTCTVPSCAILGDEKDSQPRTHRVPRGISPARPFLVHVRMLHVQGMLPLANPSTNGHGEGQSTYEQQQMVRQQQQQVEEEDIYGLMEMEAHANRNTGLARSTMITIRFQVGRER